MYSVEYNNVFIALVVTSFGRYDHHHARAIQILKSWLHVLHKNVKLCGIPFTSMSVFVINLKWNPMQLDILCTTCNQPF